MELVLSLLLLAQVLINTFRANIVTSSCVCVKLLIMCFFVFITSRQQFKEVYLVTNADKYV